MDAHQRMQDMHLAARLSPEHPPNPMRTNRSVHLLNAPLFRAAPPLLWFIPAVTAVLLASLLCTAVLRSARCLRGALSGRRRGASAPTLSQRRRALAVRLRSLKDCRSSAAAVRDLQAALSEAEDLHMAADPPARAARDRLRRLLRSKSSSSASSASSSSSSHRRGGKLEAAAAAASAASAATQPLPSQRKRRGKHRPAAPAQSPTQPPTEPPASLRSAAPRSAVPTPAAPDAAAPPVERRRTCTDTLCPCGAARPHGGHLRSAACPRTQADASKHPPERSPHPARLKSPQLPSPPDSPKHSTALDSDSRASSRCSSQAETQQRRTSGSDPATAPGTPPPQPPTAITFAQPRSGKAGPDAEHSNPPLPPAFSPEAAAAPPFIPAAPTCPWPLPSAFLHPGEDFHAASARPASPSQTPAAPPSFAAAPACAPLPPAALLHTHRSELLSATSQHSPLAACTSASSLNHNARSFVPSASGHFSPSPRGSVAAEAFRRALTLHDLGQPATDPSPPTRTPQPLFSPGTSHPCDLPSPNADWLPRTLSPVAARSPVATTPLSCATTTGFSPALPPSAQMQAALDRFAAACNHTCSHTCSDAAINASQGAPSLQEGGSVSPAGRAWGFAVEGGLVPRQVPPIQPPMHASPPECNRSPLQNYSMWTGSTIW